MRLPAIPAVLREERQFRLLFAGAALSVIGDRVTMVALPFAVLAAGGGITEVGLVAAAQFAPFLLLGLPAGVIADKRDRRLIVLGSDAIRGICQAVAAALLLTGVAEPWHLGVLAAAYGAADAFAAPAFTGLLPQTISTPVHLQPANALRGASMSAGSIGGPILGGGLVALAGPGGALLFDAATFAVGVACLWKLRPAALPPTAAEDASGFLSQLREGWTEVRSRSWVWSFLLAMVVYHVVVLPSVYVLGPVLADRELGGASAWGAIVAAFGIGSLAGDALLMRWRPRFALRASAIALVVASTQAVIYGSGLPLEGILVLQAIAGIGVSCFFTLWETSLQEHVPPRMLSRVSSYDYMANVGFMPLGAALAAPVAAALGIQTTLAVMSAVGVATGLAVLAVPAVRRLPRAAA